VSWRCRVLAVTVERRLQVHQSTHPNDVALADGVAVICRHRTAATCPVIVPS
jgi:hypothetical protein